MKTFIMRLMTLVLTTGMAYGEATGQAPPIPSEEQPEVLTRGPVNEAFAKPVTLEDQTGFIAPTQPPANAEEVPPAEKPSGEQFAWVPGYWAWDSERKGYIWVSGCWRAVPPGRYWFPDYWSQTDQGWRGYDDLARTAKAWQNAGTRHREYSTGQSIDSQSTDDR